MEIVENQIGKPYFFNASIFLAEYECGPSARILEFAIVVCGPEEIILTFVFEALCLGALFLAFAFEKLG